MLRGARTLFKQQKSLLIKDSDRDVISEKLQGKGSVFFLPLRFVTAQLRTRQGRTKLSLRQPTRENQSLIAITFGNKSSLLAFP